jgi:hypothetical protein
MNRSWAATIITLAVLLFSLWGLLLLDPMRFALDALASGGSGPQDAMVSNVYSDPHTQETSKGEHPLASLRQLEHDWCAAPSRHRFILAGNSQTMTVMLSPQERPSSAVEHTYPDLLLAELQLNGESIGGYRLAAPNLSYVELLWYVRYLLTRPCLVPNQLIVQLNFESFRKLGVRDGMLELLDDPQFAQAAASEAGTSEPYAPAFQQAIDRYRTRRAQQRGVVGAGAQQSRTGMIEARGFGGLLETRIRSWLDRSVTFRSRARIKAEFETLLYLARVKLLGIKPTTRRSLGGAALQMSISSLRRVGILCRNDGVHLTFFNAPQNPNAPLYRNQSDRQEYERIVSDLSTNYASSYFNFEASVPADMWGVWIDGPDPIHFGRAGHQRLADEMFKAGLTAKL